VASSGWKISALSISELYNTTNNPFGQVVKCHDCHTSLVSLTAQKTYQLGDMTITAPRRHLSVDFAAVPGVPRSFNFPLSNVLYPRTSLPR